MPAPDRIPPRHRSSAWESTGCGSASAAEAATRHLRLSGFGEGCGLVGTVDLYIAPAGAGGGITSGLVMAATSYATLASIGGLLAVAVIPFVASRTRRAGT
jgi:hypothetical protein